MRKHRTNSKQGGGVNLYFNSLSEFRMSSSLTALITSTLNSKIQSVA